MKLKYVKIITACLFLFMACFVQSPSNSAYAECPNAASEPGFFESMLSGIGNFISGVADFVGDVVSGIGDFMGDVFSFVGDLISDIASGVGDFFDSVVDAIGSAFSSISSSVGSMFDPTGQQNAVDTGTKTENLATINTGLTAGSLAGANWSVTNITPTATGFSYTATSGTYTNPNATGNENTTTQTTYTTTATFTNPTTTTTTEVTTGLGTNQVPITSTVEQAAPSNNITVTMSFTAPEPKSEPLPPMALPTVVDYYDFDNTINGNELLFTLNPGGVVNLIVDKVHKGSSVALPTYFSQVLTTMQPNYQISTTNYSEWSNVVGALPLNYSGKYSWTSAELISPSGRSYKISNLSPPSTALPMGTVGDLVPSTRSYITDPFAAYTYDLPMGGIYFRNMSYFYSGTYYIIDEWNIKEISFASTLPKEEHISNTPQIFDEVGVWLLRWRIDNLNYLDTDTNKYLNAFYAVKNANNFTSTRNTGYFKVPRWDGNELIDGPFGWNYDPYNFGNVFDGSLTSTTNTMNSVIAANSSKDDPSLPRTSNSLRLWTDPSSTSENVGTVTIIVIDGTNPDGSSTLNGAYGNFSIGTGSYRTGGPNGHSRTTDVNSPTTQDETTEFDSVRVQAAVEACWKARIK